MSDLVSERIHLSKADVGELEEQYVLRALRSGWIAPLGPEVDLFEEEMAARVGVDHALALSSGTAALHLALLQVGARPGTVVIAPTLTFAATANAIKYTGAEPVFVDSHESDGNVDPSLLIEAVDTLRSEDKEVAAVVTVDLYGRACAYRLIEDEIAARGIPLVEDAAEALGASYDGRSAGSFGTVSAVSFNGNKIMTTSGGGMLLSNDAELITHARKLSTQAREPVEWYEHKEVGYNYRLSNILAALGRAQLSRLDGMIARRQAHREAYLEALSDLDGVRFLAPPPSEAGPEFRDNYWLTAIELAKPRTATDLRLHLVSHNIESRPLWKPMHMQPVFKGARTFLNGTSQQQFYSGLALPSGSELTKDEVETVCETICAFLCRE